MSDQRDVREMVKEAYGSVARQQSCGCGCGGKAPCDAESDQAVPEADLGLSCGNPVAFSHIKPGDVVVDLGSGAGRDVFLAAEKTGPTGRVIGVDMTPDMLALARRNAESLRQRTGLTNVEFREGQIESLPIESGTVDLIISNCVINLSPDKPQVFREVFRVLKAGGRMVVSDIVLNRELPEAVRRSDQLYAACIAGALLRQDYFKAIEGAGFGTIEVLSDKLYSASQCGDDPITCQCGDNLEGIASSVTVLAVKRD